MDDITQIKSEVIQCTKCDLAKTRKNSVPGKGYQHSDVMFVGEAPGRSEDMQGEPFVGVAGKILSDALEQAGMSRDSTYITNVVKCRPPNNRIPSCIEKESCAEYLQREIHAISPRIICVLGNTAFNSVLGGSEIIKNRGKIIRKDGQLYFVTVHPAATIYRKELLDVLISDIDKLSRIITELKNGKDIPADIEHTP